MPFSLIRIASQWCLAQTKTKFSPYPLTSRPTRLRPWSRHTRPENLQKAASDHTGRMTLHTSSDNRGDNRLYANELCQGSCEVEVEPVDSILMANVIEAVDLTKMDVQGYESHVLAGMKDIVRNSTKIVLLSEFWPDGLRRAGSDPARYLLDLQALGLNIFELTDEAEIVPVTNPDELIRRFPGRRYTNVVGLKGTTSLFRAII
jgi:FkbM family methyltransferase